MLTKTLLTQPKSRSTGHFLGCTNMAIEMFLIFSMYFFYEVMKGLLHNRIPNNGFYKEGQLVFDRSHPRSIKSVSLSTFRSGIEITNVALFKRVYVCVCVLVFRAIVGEKSRHSLQDSLHLITVPTQVIWGKEDQVGSCKLHFFIQSLLIFSF